MYNDDFLYCRSANVPGSSNMAAGGNRRLQQTQHQVDEVKVWSDSSVILFLKETYVIRRDNFAKAVLKPREVPSVQTLAAVLVLEDLA